MDLDGAELSVNDHVPGEKLSFYNREDPPMVVGIVTIV